MDPQQQLEVCQRKIIAALGMAPDRTLTWEQLSDIEEWDDLPTRWDRQNALFLLQITGVVDLADDYSWVRLREDWAEAQPD